MAGDEHRAGDGSPPASSFPARAVAEEPRTWAERVRHLEHELRRVRRSRRVLMDLLVRLDQQWRQRLEGLEEENRRLWSRCRSDAAVPRR